MSTPFVRVNRAPQQIVSILGGVALSLALVKWGLSRRAERAGR